MDYFCSMIGSHRGKGDFFCIGNPVTKQQLALPPIPVHFTIDSRSGLAYVPSTREYKVVHVVEAEGNRLCCVVLTVGADKLWRQININHISERAKPVLHLPLFSIGAFIYWTDTCTGYIIALDLETEIIYQVRRPRGYSKHRGRFSKMGSFLSWMDTPAAGQLKWQVWALTEFKLGVWTKVFNIDLTAQRYLLEQMLHPKTNFILRPIGWLRNGEVVVFRALGGSNTFIAHNIKTGKTSSCGSDGNDWYPKYREHVNSLVSLKE